jgi:fatty acid desaturase
MGKTKSTDSEFWKKWEALREKRLQEKRAHENHSCFTNLSIIGIAIGGGLGFRLGGIPLITIGFAVGFALVGVVIDWYQYRRERDGD